MIFVYIQHKYSFVLFGNFCSFKNNTRRLSLVMRDEFFKGQDLAVYWIEHVIRFNGTDHLRPTSQNIPFYQLYLLDVGFFLVFVGLTIFGIFSNITRYIIRLSLAKPFIVQVQLEPIAFNCIILMRWLCIKIW